MIRTIQRIARHAALALLGIHSAGIACGAEPDASPNPADLAQAFAEAGQPGPEHAALEPLVGEWTYTSKFWMTPDQPPLESEGTITRKWVLGGRFLEERIEGTNFDGTPGFEGFGLIGYDKGRKKYTTSWACSMGTGTCSGLGVSESAGTFTFETEAFCPLQQKIVKGRESIRFEGENRTVAESWVIEDGQEFKVMELISTRRK